MLERHHFNVLFINEIKCISDTVGSKIQNPWDVEIVYLDNVFTIIVENNCRKVILPLPKMVCLTWDRGYVRTLTWLRRMSVGWLEMTELGFYDIIEAIYKKWFIDWTLWNAKK